MAGPWPGEVVCVGLGDDHDDGGDSDGGGVDDDDDGCGGGILGASMTVNVAIGH